MVSSAEPVVRDADHDDVVAICRFGEAHIRPHYAPLIGAAAADEQVRRWWNETHIGAAVAGGLVVVAEADGQRGRSGADHVVYKLYLHPHHRGRGLGPQLLDALTRQLPANADRLYVEHFVANERAGAFYEREGFTVQRIEPSPTGDPALGVVWRARHLASPAQASRQAWRDVQASADGEGEPANPQQRSLEGPSVTSTLRSGRSEDPELRSTEAGIARARFRVAVSDRREQEPSFFTGQPGRGRGSAPAADLDR